MKITVWIDWECLLELKNLKENREHFNERNFSTSIHIPCYSIKNKTAGWVTLQGAMHIASLIKKNPYIPVQ